MLHFTLKTLYVMKNIMCHPLWTSSSCYVISSGCSNLCSLLYIYPYLFIYNSLTGVCVCVVADFRECFSLYDRQRKGKIEAQELITVMRCLGSNPTPSEVQRHLLSHNIGTCVTRLSELYSDQISPASCASLPESIKPPKLPASIATRPSACSSRVPAHLWLVKHTNLCLFC